MNLIVHGGATQNAVKFEKLKAHLLEVIELLGRNNAYYGSVQWDDEDLDRVAGMVVDNNAAIAKLKAALAN